MDIRMRSLFSPIIALCFSGLSGVATAQSPEEMGVDVLHKSTLSMIDYVKKTIFATTLDIQSDIDGRIKAMKRGYSKIDVIVVDNVTPGALANFSKNKRIIFYSTGTTLLLLYYTTYAAIINTPGSFSNRLCSSYPDYLGKAFSDANGRVSLEAFLKTTSPPETYCQAHDSPELEAEKGKLLAETVIPATAFMLGHEYGHHLLGHLPLTHQLSPQEARQLESQADSFGSSMLWRIPRAPAVVIFDILSRYAEKDVFDQAASHEPEECRYLSLFTDDRRFLDETSVNNIMTALAARKDVSKSLSSFSKRVFGMTNSEIEALCPSIAPYVMFRQ